MAGCPKCLWTNILLWDLLLLLLLLLLVVLLILCERAIPTKWLRVLVMIRLFRRYLRLQSRRLHILLSSMIVIRSSVGEQCWSIGGLLLNSWYVLLTHRITGIWSNKPSRTVIVVVISLMGMLREILRRLCISLLGRRRDVFRRILCCAYKRRWFWRCICSCTHESRRCSRLGFISSATVIADVVGSVDRLCCLLWRIERRRRVLVYMAVRSIHKDLFFVFSATTTSIANVIAASDWGIRVIWDVIRGRRLQTAGSVVASLHGGLLGWRRLLLDLLLLLLLLLLLFLYE